MSVLVVMFAGALVVLACVLICQGVSWMSSPRWLNAATDGETNFVYGVVVLACAAGIAWLGSLGL